MKYSSSVSLDVSPDVVRPFVSDLAKYPEWMPLVHSAVAKDDDAWDVELRAKVGVFARSKRLRMRRTLNSDDLFVFERDENDGRRHSPWLMRVSLIPTPNGCIVSIDLSYGGNLWSAGVLDRVLASQVDAGKAGLASVVHGA
ncbi:MAG: SRPBCC family protein [Ilumatobacteraceae bacterium]